MTEHQNKIVKIYNSKGYDMNIGSFFNFVNQKVQIDSFSIQLIKQKIQQFGIEQSFDERIFRFLLRLTAATQSNGDKVKNMNKSQINELTKFIVFKSSKKSKNNLKQSEIVENQKDSHTYKPHVDKDNESSNPARQYNRKQQNLQKNHLNIKPSSAVKLQQITQEETQTQKITATQKQKIINNKITKEFEIQKKQQRNQQKKSYPEDNQKIKKQKQSSKEQQKYEQTRHKSTENKKNIQQLKCKNTAQNKKPTGLKTIYQVQNSSEINLKQSQKQKTHPKFLDLTDSKDERQKAKITQYQKFSTDYVNSIIKYTIQYQGKKVLRRFSQFQKLINLLREKYQGIILPELPPKEGIKAGMSYFLGLDQSFLQQRKKKLQQLLNRLLESTFISQDQILKRFLLDQNYQIEYAQQGYANYIKSLTDIAFNARQLKDYGVAYYNYLKQKGNVKLNPQIQRKYQELLKIIKIFMDLNQYRKKINDNFDKRRQLFFEMGIKTNKPCNSSFDKKMDLIQQQIKNLNFQIEKYKKLKFQQSWIHELIRQKQADNTKATNQLLQNEAKIEGRIKKMEQNLNISLQQFRICKIKQLQEINDQIINWRQNVHPGQIHENQKKQNL